MAAVSALLGVFEGDASTTNKCPSFRSNGLNTQRALLFTFDFTGRWLVKLNQLKFNESFNKKWRW